MATLWQRLNFLPLPHQQGSLALSVVVVVHRSMVFLGQQATAGLAHHVERAGDEHEVVVGGDRPAPGRPPADTSATASAAMPSRSAAAATSGAGMARGDGGVQATTKPASVAPERLEHLGRVAALRAGRRP